MDQKAIEIENLTRRFGEVKALDRINLTVRQGEFFSLLGPSGCGKTTLLRIIAGLDLPDEGLVRIAGQDARGIPAHKRPVNTVFQSYALFPHLTVWDNVAFGLRMKKVPRAQMEERVSRIMELVEIQALAERKPTQLSGGQKQRVALARALVNEPSVLLLDEPLGALDLKLRKQLQVDLRNLQRRLGMTFLYVTHDQEEALVLSDRIAVMRDGRIEQMGEPETLYEKPATRFVSQFLGTCSLIEASVTNLSEHRFLARTPVGELIVEHSTLDRSAVTLAIRPEKVQLHATRHARTENCVQAQLEEVIYVGSETHYVVRCGKQELRAEVMNSHRAHEVFRPGQDVIAYLPPDALIVLED